MGQASNNPFKEGGQFISDYTIQTKNVDLCLTYLVHKKNQREYLLRELTFNDIRQFTIVSEKIKNRKNISNAHLTNLQKVYEANQDQMCSNIYKFYTLWEYPIKSLAEEINERALQKKKFARKQLSSILACSIMGLATFQKNQIKHECLTSKSIMMSKDGNIKIVDPLAIGSEANIESVHNNRNLKNIYLSPEQCESIQTQKPIINKNPYKNDVFTLGMIILECGLLQRKDDCYMDDCSRINWQKIQKNLNRFGEFYGEDQKKLIELMLKRDIRGRPDWMDLNNYVDSQEQMSNLMQSETNGQISVRKTAKRQTFITRTIANQNAPRTSRSQKKIISPNKRFNQINSERPNVNHLLPHNNQVNTNFFNENHERNGSIPQNSNYVARSFEEPLKPTNKTINNINKNNYNFSGSIPYSLYEPNRQAQQGWRNISVPSSTDATAMLNIKSNQTPISSSYNNFQLMQKQALVETNKINSTNALAFYETNNVNFSHQIPFTQRPQFIFETNSKYMPPQDRRQLGIQKSGRILQPTPKVDNNKYSIFQGLTSGFESKLPFNNSFSTSSPQVLNTYIKPTESFNYQVLKQETPPQSKISGHRPTHTNAFDLQFTKTPEIVDHSELEIHPQYVDEFFKMGSRYEGYKLNGMRHGKGKFYYQDGGSYDGQWKQNKMNGFGTLYYQSNLKAYEGHWVNDQFEGEGILYNQHPIKLQESFDYKNFDQIDDCWERYEGQFTEDLKNGKGKLIFSNGEVFEGTFKEDMVEGEGIFYCKNGRRIHGIWTQNVLAQQFS